MADQAGCSEASVAVPVNEGVIIGKRQPASEAYPKPLDIFYGITYATAERFRPAQSCAPVNKGRVLDAQNVGKYVPCPMASFETEEGTLRLNIFRPSKPSSDSSSGDTKLPVGCRGAFYWPSPRAPGSSGLHRGHSRVRGADCPVGPLPPARAAARRRRRPVHCATSRRVSSSTWPFQPVVDGAGGVIPDIPLRQVDALCRSDWARTLSVITGFCSHEGTQFVPLDLATNAQFSALVPSLTGGHLDALERLYPDAVTGPSKPYENAPGCRHGAQFRRLHEAYAHYAYICPVLHTAHRLSCAGARVYLYEYAATSEPFGAASHGDQAPVVAHDMETLRGQRRLVAVAEEMASRWGQFMVSPTGEITSWPRFQSPFGDGRGGGELLVFGKGNDEAAGGKSEGVAVRKRILTDEEMAQCKFWWDRMELSQGMGVSGQYRE
ncbi:HET-domain-containing protein [Metarhizium robertsii ARSEF 23]|uniref:HET-domain-containing protein n=1 Tax=Metarhizium robertsii (strain ARSEF 23 / ATCC MYA-3075) TaxID=655844 RepID=A0A0B2XA99_METRA|nr:HET-domain-containing protein [Metarhizium robertsii ARSEF 23]KHO11783.1 HET-domain-containing protein [Metarhizium robertsii ARSEF 23]